MSADFCCESPTPWIKSVKAKPIPAYLPSWAWSCPMVTLCQLVKTFFLPEMRTSSGLALDKVWMRFHLEDDVDAWVRLRQRFDVSEMRFWCGLSCVKSVKQSPPLLHGDTLSCPITGQHVNWPWSWWWWWGWLGWWGWGWWGWWWGRPSGSWVESFIPDDP